MRSRSLGAMLASGICVYGVAFGGGASAQNAALQYWPAMFILKEEPIRVAIERAAEEDPNGVVWEVHPEFLTVLEDPSVEFAVTQLLQGAAIDDCDFAYQGDRYTHGRLPHLAGMRSCAMLLNVRARLARDDGRVERSGDYTAAMFRIACHLDSQEHYIVSMVTSTIVYEASEAAIELLHTDGCTDDQSERIIAAIGSLDADDPTGMRRTFRSEVKAETDSLRRLLCTDTIEASMAGYRELCGDDYEEGDAEDLYQSEMPTLEDVRRSIDQYEAALARAAEAWEEEDVVGALDRLCKAVDAKEYGPLARMMMPALNNAAEKALGAETRLRDARHAIDQFQAQGSPVEPESTPGSR